MTPTLPPRITRVRIRNYRSIASCDVALGPLSLFVGPNGSGKSNFLDALRFTAGALRHTLDHALRERGGIGEVRRRSRGHPNHFRIGLDLKLSDGEGTYEFEVGARRGGFSVRRERCRVRSADPARTGEFVMVNGGLHRGSHPLPPAGAAGDRLYLLSASTNPIFRRMFDFLSRMGFHDLNPQRMGDLQPPSPGDLLDGDGGNLASVIARMRANAPHRLERIERYLSAVVPGMVGVRQRELGPMLTLEFRQRVRGDGHPWRFLAASVSNGTLHALGVLTALFQGDPGSVGVVGIEEPESGLHPAAAEVLMDALSEASERRQVLAATHSADLLDVPEIATASLRAVVMEEGVTRVALLDEAGRGILREGLATPGELLRLGHLAPAPDPSAPLSCGPGGGTDPVRRARIN